MKLYLDLPDQSERLHLDVNFWSFMKCTFLVQLALTGMIYGTILIFALAIGLIGMI